MPARNASAGNSICLKNDNQQIQLNTCKFRHALINTKKLLLLWKGYNKIVDSKILQTGNLYSDNYIKRKKQIFLIISKFLWRL